VNGQETWTLETEMAVQLADNGLERCKR